MSKSTPPVSTPEPEPATDDPYEPDDPFAEEEEPIIEEQITVVGDVTEEHFFGHPPVGLIPFTIFNAEGVIGNPADVILVGSEDESPHAKMRHPHGSEENRVIGYWLNR